MDFVVNRAIQTTNASPELLLPRGTSSAVYAVPTFVVHSDVMCLEALIKDSRFGLLIGQCCHVVTEKASTCQVVGVAP